MRETAKTAQLIAPLQGFSFHWTAGLESSAYRDSSLLPSRVLRQLHQTCSEFERAWGSSTALTIESIIASHTGWERSILLQWLIRAELDLQGVEQQSTEPTAWLARFPNDQDAVKRVWQLDEHHDFRTQSSSICSPQQLNSQLLPSTSPLVLLGPYEILNEIARGGMGIVYRARHTSLRRIVALKVLQGGQFARSADLFRFRQEAQSIASIEHPGIVPVYDVGEFEGHAYFSMLLLEGGNLADRLRDGPLPPNQAAEITRQVACAIHAAHLRGIVHRDIKPRNILFDSRGNARVTDFGLAKLLFAPINGNTDDSCSPNPTCSGQILGTPAYMSPEQATGNSASVSVQSDVYSLGAVLYSLLTGRPPFQAATSWGTIQQVIGAYAVAPRQLNAQIPVDLETVAQKCLAKSVTERYQTAQDLADDLQRFLTQQPIKARRTSHLVRIFRWCRRNPGWATAAMSIIIAMTCLSVVTITLSAWALREESRARSSLINSKLAEARATTLSRLSGQRFHSLATLQEIPSIARYERLLPDQQRSMCNTAIAALSQSDLELQRTWPGFPVGSLAFDVDDSFQLYARTDLHGNCSIRRLLDDTEIDAIACPGKNGKLLALPTLSRDGTYLIIHYRDTTADGSPSTGSRSFARAWRIADSHLTPIIAIADCSAIDVAHGRNTIVSVDSHGSITRYDLASGRQVGVTLAPDTLLGNIILATHPAKPEVAIASPTENVAVIRNLDDGRVLHRMMVPKGCHHLAWHPFGKTLAMSGNGEHWIRIIDGQSGQLLSTIVTPTGGVRISYSHDGEHLATVEWGRVVRLWDIASRQQQVAISRANSVGPVRFSADDCRIAVSTDDHEVAEVKCGLNYVCRSLSIEGQPPDELYLGTTISHDSRLLAAATTHGVAFWDLTYPTSHAFLPIPNALAVLFEPPTPGDANSSLQTASLLISSSSGTYRWPWSVSSTFPGEVEIGPPRKTMIPPTTCLVNSSDGRTVAAGIRAVGQFQPSAGVWLLDRDGDSQLRQVAAGTDIWSVAISPNGRHLVTCDYEWATGQLWDAGNGSPLTRLEQSSIFGNFSGDGHWFMMGYRPGQLIDATSWQPVRTFVRGGWLNRDGTFFASRADDDSLSLIDRETGREIVSLTCAPPQATNQAEFSADGRFLVSRNCQHGIRVWDLQRLYEQLSELSLAPAEPLGTPNRQRIAASTAHPPPQNLSHSVVGFRLLTR
ncbi:MAG: WD40 repeat domain-containing serine/threonine protein kinase [Pirellulaceae bacterium]